LPTKEIKRVLVVGSWAKEQITIENIKKKLGVKVFAYLSIHNPAIVSLVDGYKIGAFDRKDQIVDYAKKQNIDLTLITTAQPLSIGVVDALEQDNISVFGPSQKAAKLETDKAFTRQFMKKHKIDALPQFKVFDNREKAIRYASSFNWKVAIKPIGLTEGIGVRVFGDQLRNQDDVINYIHEIFDKKIGGDTRVLIEEKLVGNEFTIQCLVNKKHILVTPAVQDFKRLLPGDKGPNTASMGSYSDKGFLLPFMKEEEYLKAVNIITKTVMAFTKDTGENCKGFLYGQFMKTENGIKLIEYNFRPGDPEWMNTISVIKENLIDVIHDLMDGMKQSIHFKKKATVCKYIVPKGYPKFMNQVLDVTFDAQTIKNLGVDIYYSTGLDEKRRLRVGCERGIAFISKADTIAMANELVEKAISTINGDFHYRKDIATIKVII
jgi:phosphoribosylamine--glycine ligase